MNRACLLCDGMLYNWMSEESSEVLTDTQYLSVPLN